ncbi:MAG: hypothetical protein WKG07_44110 [Hymenobacter sp.]
MVWRFLGLGARVRRWRRCWRPAPPRSAQTAPGRPTPRPAPIRSRAAPHRLPEARVRAVRPERFAVGSRRLEVDSAVLGAVPGRHRGRRAASSCPGSTSRTTDRGRLAYHLAAGHVGAAHGRALERG